MEITPYVLGALHYFPSNTNNATANKDKISEHKALWKFCQQLCPFCLNREKAIHTPFMSQIVLQILNFLPYDFGHFRTRSRKKF